MIWKVFWKSLQSGIEILLLLLLEIGTFSITLTDFTAIYFAAIMKGGKEEHNDSKETAYPDPKGEVSLVFDIQEKGPF